ncbi:TonB-dependent receptor [Sphingomonas sanxanigenens]|uniref:TonB-denpendent receptor n=1 Tax=Sphingomonas sanxanigenens DSM 19645 = NX02 TaxID=1123269 RepID=W0AL59_9SPHN|nr:TonB-dependent receptor [Sphingomonas sanxanigenens]AHE57018.1 hypothetical protein NX02_27160 [Sphingomonas sanxanigenens DSM 19645 = NX02]
MIRSLLLAGSAFFFVQPAFAQQAEIPVPSTADEQPQSGTAGSDARPARGGDFHAAPSNDLIVTAPFQRRREDVLSGTSVLSGEALTLALRPSIGDTLTHVAGVSATSFGPNASRPILRGFQGDRVRILTDGIGSFDVSNTSVDHAVAINPLTADRIEVLRGPSALLYGSSAIGGVVNVVDSRIPRSVPDEPIHVEAVAGYGSAANERSISSAVVAPIGSKFVVHVDGSYSKTDDLETGGYILSRERRAEALASGDAEIAALADLKGKLPNSAGRTWEVAGGAAIITDGGNLGISVNHLDSLYGVPVRYALTPGGEAEQVQLDMKQTRADLRAEVNTGGGFLDKVRLRAGYADYQHSELEDTGEVGTTFYAEGIEARLELVQAKRGGWEGAFGGQLLIRDFNVVGEEKFLPKNETQQYGVFTLQSFDFGALRAEAGARYEYSRLSAIADGDLGNPAYARSFDAFSGSLGASYELAPAWRIGLNLSRSERAPSAEELFSRGNHAGTQAFELGDPTLTKEKSWGIEGTLRGKGEGYSFSASVFHNWFDDYIYETQVDPSVCEAVSGGELEFPCFNIRQADARYYGFEVEGSARVFTLGNYTLNVDGLADYVRAKVTHVGDAPRIPPLRMLGGLELQAGSATGRVEVEHVFDQKKLSAFETETDGYTMVNAAVSVKPFGYDSATSISLSANNIFDVVARRHASFLKDFAPLAGRDIRVTARVAF